MLGYKYVTSVQNKYNVELKVIASLVSARQKQY